MPLTTLDPITALVVIDLQKGIVALPAVHPMREIIAHNVELLRAFRKRHLPVVLVNVAGAAPGRTHAGPRNFVFPPDWTELIPELETHPNDHLVTKRRPGAFLGTDLDQYLRARGVTQIVLTGVATSNGVEATARSAFDLGYHVTFIVDAMTDRDAEAHRYSVERTFPRIGETGTTAELIAFFAVC
jgi:nicotinamidase-related amidase